MQFDDVVTGRRSIRGYKSDPVPKALIEEVLALAMRSPSSMNTQPWNFTVVSGEPLDSFALVILSAISQAYRILANFVLASFCRATSRSSGRRCQAIVCCHGHCP